LARRKLADRDWVGLSEASGVLGVSPATLARQQAEAAGLRFMRSASLNAMPQFIEALAAVAQRTLPELEGGRIDKETVGISLGFPRS
jgi:hypothetical protein